MKSIKRLLIDNVDENGDRDNSKMVQPLLIKRNTQNPGCHLSPYEVFLCQKLRDVLPFIWKNVELSTNTQISDEWRRVRQMKEESLKTRYMKSLGKLEEHSHQLPLLQAGCQAMIQNQTRQCMTGWDCSGVIVDFLGNDQYCVKVAGTGWIIIRDRRYLRKYEPHLRHGTTSVVLPEKHLLFALKPLLSDPRSLIGVLWASPTQSSPTTAVDQGSNDFPNPMVPEQIPIESNDSRDAT